MGINKILKEFTDMEEELHTESGTFTIDKKGIVVRFVPNPDNIVQEKTEIRKNYTYTTYRTLRTFIVPKGVIGFPSNFLRDTKVSERFELPEDLESIGTIIPDDIMESVMCVFADCILPEVIFPKSLKSIGAYAFGHCHIASIQIPSSLRSPYGRQFKDSYINLVKLPKEWNTGEMEFEDHYLYTGTQKAFSNDFGYLTW